MATENDTDTSVYREKYFTDIYKNIPVAEALFDLKGNLIDMNDAFIETFNLFSDEDKYYYNLFKDANIPNELQDSILSNRKYSFRLKYSFEKTGFKHTLRKDLADMNFRTVKLFNSKEECDGFLLVCIEETSLLNALNRVQDFNNIFSLVSKLGKIGYIKYNFISETGYASNQWFNNIGESEDTPLKNIFGVFNAVNPEDRPLLNEKIEKIKNGIKNELSIQYQVQIPNESNKWKWIHAKYFTTTYSPQDKIVEIIGINYDITNFKEAIDAREKAELSNKLNSAFLANMSHEIRTPLNAIVGFSELLQTSDNEKDKAEFINIINKNNDLLLHLINDILNLSKIESGFVEIQVKKFDLSTLFNEIFATQKFRCTNPDIEFRGNNPYKSCIINYDRDRLTEVWTNYISNALKYTSHGHILMGYEYVNKGIKIYVEDTGKGIPAEKQHMLFQRFEKLGSFVQGSGLGLAICKAIIEASNGHVGLKSADGEGSTFWAWIPCEVQITQ